MGAVLMTASLSVILTEALSNLRADLSRDTEKEADQ